MGARGRDLIADAEWDEVWAAYDRRHPAKAPRRVPQRPELKLDTPAPRAAARPRSRRRLLLALGTLCLGVAWLAAPGTAAWDLARALERNDAAAMLQHMDLAAVQAGVRQDLASAVTFPADGPAADFLLGMADDMARAWANPTALGEIAQVRGIGHGAVGLLRAQKLTLTSFEMPLGAAASPVTLRFELRDGGFAPRWQVTNVRISMNAPVVLPAPPLRLSMR
jgi:hypothetical protein